MASKIFFSHQKVYFWISAFDHRAIVLDKMHIVHCSVLYHIMEPELPCPVFQSSQILTLVELECATQQTKSPCYVSKSWQFFNLVELKCAK